MRTTQPGTPDERLALEHWFLPQPLKAVTEEYVDRPNRTTVFPTTPNTDSLTTEWFTANEAAFVDLMTMR